MKIKTIKKQTQKLALILGLGGLNGTVALAALAGLFVPTNALSNAFLFMAGPGSIITAALSNGSTQERILSALLAGIIATIIVISAAALGPLFLKSLNITILKISGAIAIGCIALLIAGLPVPEKLPLLIIIIGMIGGLILK